MPINRNLSNLPGPALPDHRPDKDSPWAKALAARWAAEFVDDDTRETAAPCLIRHSEAAKCSRAIWYRLMGYEPTEHLELADHYRFNIGKLVHDQYQQALKDEYPGAETEFVVVSGFGKFDQGKRSLSAGHGDVLLKHGDKTVAIELKTRNGYGFQRAIGLKGNAEGPQWSAVVQGAVNAHLAGADESVIVYLSTDVISANQAAKAGLESWERFSAAWTYTRKEFEPIALEELARWESIARDYEAGVPSPRSIPDPEIPEDATVRPGTTVGNWTVTIDGQIFDTGTTWHCGYCPFRSQCVDDYAAER